MDDVPTGSQDSLRTNGPVILRVGLGEADPEARPDWGFSTMGRGKNTSWWSNLPVIYQGILGRSTGGPNVLPGSKLAYFV